MANLGNNTVVEAFVRALVAAYPSIEIIHDPVVLRNDPGEAEEFVFLVDEWTLGCDDLPEREVFIDCTPTGGSWWFQIGGLDVQTGDVGTLTALRVASFFGLDNGANWEVM